ncbi:hypothetical protein [Sphingomonas sp. GB1N7]|uniref:hypothetical protein n=1 Tax=Parasphingomonas caseinilytica TaxID=3096158 RepID=UPI003FA7C760
MRRDHLCHFGFAHHLGIFRLQVEQVRLVRCGIAIAAGFANDDVSDDDLSGGNLIAS